LSTPHKRYSDLCGEAPKRFRVSAPQESTFKDQHTQLNLIGDVTAQDVSYQGPLAYESALNLTSRLNVEECHSTYGSEYYTVAER